MLRSTNGEKDQMSSSETNARYVPKINATTRLNGKVRYSRCSTAGIERNAPAMMAGVVPSNRATRITASKEISAARKFGTTTRTHTPRVNGTHIHASNPSIWPTLRRVLSNRFLNTIDRESALENAAATPSLTNSVIRISLESITTSLYSVSRIDSQGRLRTYNRSMPFESVRKAAEADFPTRWGHFRIFGFVGTRVREVPDAECATDPNQSEEMVALV